MSHLSVAHEQLSAAITSGDLSKTTAVLDILTWDDVEEMDRTALEGLLSGAEGLLPEYLPGQPEPEWSAAHDSLADAVERVRDMVSECELSDHLDD